MIGREFPLGLVGRLFSTSDDELNRMLSDLQLAEFIYEQPATGDIEYIFKHALTQAVAYNSVLAERRKILHERTGEAIEALYAEHIEDRLDGLAQHFSRSANVAKAVNYLHLAARQCASRTAYFQALTYLKRALDLLQTLPDTDERARQELTLQLARGDSLYVTEGFGADEGGRIFRRARELCVRLGDRSQLLPPYWDCGCSIASNLSCRPPANWKSSLYR